MANYVLYHTLGCHLCDEAEQVFAALHWQDYHKVDIADDEALVDAYGIRIPVLCHMETQQDIGWPFDSTVVSAFISACEA